MHTTKFWEANEAGREMNRSRGPAAAVNFVEATTVWRMGRIESEDTTFKVCELRYIASQKQKKERSNTCKSKKLRVLTFTSRGRRQLDCLVADPKLHAG